MRYGVTDENKTNEVPPQQKQEKPDCFYFPGRKWCLWQLAVDRLGMEGVTTSVIFAFINDRVVASVRSKNPSFEVNSQCQRIFGKEFAGGKQGAGGASVPLGVLGVGILDGDIKEG